MNRQVGLAALIVLVSACSGGSEPAATTSAVAATTPSTTTDVPAEPEPEVGIDGFNDLQLISSVRPGALVDDVRPGAALRMGLDGTGRASDTDPVDRRTFSGADADVVAMPVDSAESSGFNPVGGTFVFEVDGLRFDADTFTSIAESPIRLSWNVMQRGLARNTGGQWKLSIVNESDGSVNAQCVARDGANRLIRVNSREDLAADRAYRVSCVVDDGADRLSVAVDGELVGTSSTVLEVDNGAEVESAAAFGEVNPNGGATCKDDVPEGIGNVVALGNKPACGATLTDDDRFRGEIALARIWKK